MMTVLILWVKTLIMVILFASFLELLLPNSSMQRFVRVIMGLLIMLAILNPIIDLFRSNLISQPVASIDTHSDSSKEIKDIEKSVIRERDRLAEELYIKELARQIQSVVLAIDGVEDAKVTIKLDQTKVGHGALHKVIIYLKPGISVAKHEVTKVVISPEDRPIKNSIKPELKTKVIHTVAELYQLRDEQVEIVSIE
ncbi:MAG: Stage sporulation protein [Firmicutes bacterium]|nr:Stage sporulation protein [Bacillota bacterium]